MRIYGLHRPDKTSHRPGEQKPEQPPPQPCSLHHTHYCNRYWLVLHSYYISDTYSKAICRLQESPKLQNGDQMASRGSPVPLLNIRIVLSEGAIAHSLSCLPDHPGLHVPSAGLLPGLQRDEHTPSPVMWYGTPAAAAQGIFFFFWFDCKCGRGGWDRNV